jgi:Cd2+/Zn2+-exporting ATPase
MVEIKVLDVPVILPNGYECERCVNRLRGSLLEVYGVKSVKLDPGSAKLTLEYDPNLVTLEAVERRAREIGVELEEKIVHHTIPLAGMDCPDCAVKIERAVTNLPGVLSVQVSFPASRMLIEYDPSLTSPSEVARRLRALGYAAAEAEKPKEFSIFWQKNKLWMSTAASGAALAAGLAASHFGASETAVRFCLAFSIVVGAYYMARSAVASLVAASFDTNFLMLLAAFGAVAIGQWTEGAMVVFLFSLGNTLEVYTTNRTRDSIRSLMRLSPETALVLKDGTEVQVSASQVAVGDIVLVKPGARIPVDGKVVHGNSVVDQSPITGESVPAEKGPGDEVFAGSINLSGALQVEVQKPAGETTLARIIHLVEEAQAKKAPVQRFTERFGRIYTPAVISTAVFLGVVVPFAFGGSFEVWFTRSLTLLVVACPCALVISTPVAVAAAIARAARMGVLVKGGAVLEHLAVLRVAAFDKTGTLTLGRPSVADVVSFGELSDLEVLRLAASVERLSEHPIAEAVVSAAKARGLRLEEPSRFRVQPGRGAMAEINGTNFLVGSRRYMEEQLVDVSPADPVLKRWQSAGWTAALVASDNRLIGAVAVSDTVRPEAKPALNALKDAGFHRMVMLTGDEDEVAASVARELGLDEYRSRLLPEQKVDVVNSLVKQHGRALMVGDGVNDAPALAAATVGMAMGAVGTDAALETADVALMSDDLMRIPQVVQLSRQALKIIKQNIAFSFTVVIFLVVTTLVSGLRLSLGVLGHEGSALLVILNGMRLLNWTPRS